MPVQGLVIGTFRLKEKNMFTFDYIIDGVQTDFDKTAVRDNEEDVVAQPFVRQLS
jgi:hypothetical protein